MKCKEITKEIGDLAIKRQNFDLAFADKNIAALRAIKSEISRYMIRWLAFPVSYEAKINHRDLISREYKFDYITEYHEGLAWGKRNNQAFLLNDSGEVVKDFGEIMDVDQAYPFVDGSALAFFIDTKTEDEINQPGLYLLDKNGEVLNGPFNDFEGDAKEKILCVRFEQNAKGLTTSKPNLMFVRRDGSRVENWIPVTPFSEGRAWARDAGDPKGYKLIDENLELVVNLTFSNATGVMRFSGGISVMGFDPASGTHQFHDRQGNLLQTLKMLDKIGPFSEGYAWAKHGGESRLINVHGDPIFQKNNLLYHDQFREGLALVVESTGGPCYFLDTRGNKVLPPLGEVYKDAAPFSEGLAVMDTPEGKTYFIDRHGNKVFGPFDNAFQFQDGVALVWQGFKAYYIDHRGKKVFK